MAGDSKEFTPAQQAALKRAFQTMLNQGTSTPRRTGSPTLSQPSVILQRVELTAEQRHAQRDHTQRPTRKRRRHSPTPSSNSPSSDLESASSSSEPYRKRSKRQHRHSRHRRHSPSSSPSPISRGSRKRKWPHSSHHRLPVPRKVQRAVRGGEFIDLSDLLAEHLAMTGSSANKRGAGKKALTRQITDLETWLEAWSIYACMLAATKPTLAPELFRYQKFIAKTSRTYEVYAWLQYEAQFRLKIASDPSVMERPRQ